MSDPITITMHAVATALLIIAIYGIDDAITRITTYMKELCHER